MPRSVFSSFAYKTMGKYGKHYITDQNTQIIKEISEQFSVSRQAIKIRLKQLGLFQKTQTSRLGTAHLATAYL